MRAGISWRPSRFVFQDSIVASNEEPDIATSIHRRQAPETRKKTQGIGPIVIRQVFHGSYIRLDRDVAKGDLCLKIPVTFCFGLFERLVSPVSPSLRVFQYWGT